MKRKTSKCINKATLERIFVPVESQRCVECSSEGQLDLSVMGSANGVKEEGEVKLWSVFSLLPAPTNELAGSSQWFFKSNAG